MFTHSTLAIVACLVAIAPDCASQTFINPVIPGSGPPSTIGEAPFYDKIVRRSGEGPGLMGTDAKVEAWEQAARIARSESEMFLIARQRAAGDPVMARAQMERSDIYQAVGLAAVANDPDAAGQALAVLDDPDQRARVLTAQQILRAQTGGSLDAWPIMIFASGTVTEGLGDAQRSDDDGTKPLTTGSMGVLLHTDAARYTARVNIISDNAIAPGDFGPMVLTPGSGSSLASGLLDWRGLAPDKPWYSPNHVYITASRLRMRASSADDSPIARATVLGIGVMKSRDIVNGPIYETAAALTVEAGLAARWLHGDVLADSSFKPIYDEGRNLSFGPEVGFSFTFGRVTAATQLYRLFTTGESVPGLTGLQMVAGLSVSGEFLTGKIRPIGRRGAGRPRNADQVQQ